MADMYGTIRSNTFKVKDVRAFKTWFNQYVFGEDIDVWSHVTGMGGPNDYSGTIDFGGDVQYPNAYPRQRVWNTDDGLPENEEDDDWEEEEADLDKFAAELRQHLQQGEVFYVIAGGAEKLRYVGFSELIIAEDVETPSFQTYYSDDSHETIRLRMKGDSTI